jgi:hypothetical protein
MPVIPVKLKPSTGLAGRAARWPRKVLLTRDDKGVQVLINPRSRTAFRVNVTGRPKGLEVTGGGQGIASHAGLGLLRRLADATGLTPGADVQIKSPLSTRAVAELTAKVKGR